MVEWQMCLTYKHRLRLHLFEVNIGTGVHTEFCFDRIYQSSACVVPSMDLKNDSSGDGDLYDPEFLLSSSSDGGRYRGRVGIADEVEDLDDVGDEIRRFDERVD